MNKNDKSESLLLSLISEIRQDAEKLNAIKNNRRLTMQIFEKLNLMEKIITVSALNNENRNENETPPLPPDEPPAPRPVPDRLFTPQELATYDGKDGRPTYVAFQGIVYDVSDSPRWSEGTHFGVPAGRDNTIEYRACHGGRPRLEELMPIVGRLDV